MNRSIFPRHRYGPVVWLAIAAVLISFFTRLGIMTGFSKSIDAGFSDLAGSFFIGLLFDLIIASFVVVPLTLQITFTNNFIYSGKGKWVAIIFFTICLFILCFTQIVPRDFNKTLYRILIGYVVMRFLAYGLLFFAGDNIRQKWRLFMLNLMLGMTIFGLLFNAVSEWFFWDEFSSRYNFIAVDYLVYTNEVLGNIKESYPVFLIIAIVAVITMLILLLLQKSIRLSTLHGLDVRRRLVIVIGIILLPVLSLFIVKPRWKNFSTNNYANELAGNGIYEFVQAYIANELDFYRYYQTMPDAEAFKLVRNQLAAPNSSFINNDSLSIEREIDDGYPENKMNVVLISVESLSASFMKNFGNTKSLTPDLDSLANKGMLFTNLYSSGTRTVRGLEALALSIPPTPGQSLVKRPDNEGLFSLGSVFKTKGYNTSFMYGGYGYFDNMNYFFGHNDYKVIDRAGLSSSEIHYANIWGVADEDLFTLALRNLDSDNVSGKPFFAHIMTVSNHKPYTYPDDRIDIPASAHSREGAVKYTDFAIGDFIRRASARPWFLNTVFVIVADHCASSAGSTALPVTGYHIPLIIYSPALVKPEKVNSLMAQIDVGPTLLGLLHFNYRSKFFGQDIFNTPPDKRRAFISTYQGLGFIQNDQLILQSPVRQIRSYAPDFVTGKNVSIKGDSAVIKNAIACYQVAAWLIRNKKFGK